MGIKSLLVVGYRHIDLGIFSDKDPRVTIIKMAIKKDILSFLNEGVEWFVFTGNLGFEHWTLEVLRELLAEGYQFQIATIFIFGNQGENWTESSQLKLADFKKSDFVKYAYSNYENPRQFRDYNQFLMDNTEGAYVFYDSENETNLKYLYHACPACRHHPVGPRSSAIRRSWPSSAAGVAAEQAGLWRTGPDRARWLNRRVLSGVSPDGCALDGGWGRLWQAAVDRAGGVRQRGGADWRASRHSRGPGWRMETAMNGVRASRQSRLQSTHLSVFIEYLFCPH